MAKFTHTDWVRVTDTSHVLFDNVYPIEHILSGYREWLFAIALDTLPTLLRANQLTLAEKEAA